MSLFVHIFSLFTSVDVDNPNALFAYHFATPDEDTVTPFSPHHRHRVVTAAAAEQLASVNPVRGPVTLSALRPKRSYFGVEHTVVGRLIVIDEIVGRWFLEVVVARCQLFDEGSTFPLSFDSHLCSHVVLGLEGVPEFPEWGHLPPAGLEFTASGDTVALATQFHVMEDSLQK